MASANISANNAAGGTSGILNNETNTNRAEENVQETFGMNPYETIPGSMANMNAGRATTDQFGTVPGRTSAITPYSTAVPGHMTNITGRTTAMPYNNTMPGNIAPMTGRITSQGTTSRYNDYTWDSRNVAGTGRYNDYTLDGRNYPLTGTHNATLHGRNYAGAGMHGTGVTTIGSPTDGMNAFNAPIRGRAAGGDLDRYGNQYNNNANGATNINDGTTPNVTDPGSGIQNISADLDGNVLGHIPGQVPHHGFVVRPDVRGTRFEEAAEVLGALGIMVGDEGGFRPNDTIIRSEVSKVAVYMLGLTDIAGGTTTRFPDVQAGHWASGVINVADTQRMVIGYEDGTFRPNNYITFAEAVTIVVRALGFEPAAEAAGGFPTGYLVVASQQGLLRNVQGASNEPARRGDVAQIVYNGLNANMMEQVGFGTNVTFEVVDRTILESRLDIIRETGQITANVETRLTGNSTLREDEVEINERLYRVGGTYARNLLGFSVVYYSRLDRNTNERTLIIVRPEANRNRTISINARDIQTVTGTAGERLTLFHWLNRATDRDPRRATIAADATLIWNGKYEPMDTTLLHPDSGSVTLLDTEGTDVFNVVFVNEFRNVVVEDVSLTTGRVTDKYGNQGLFLDPEDPNLTFSIIRNGQSIRLQDLREWDVLSVTTSRDRELVRVFVSNARVEGTVTEIFEAGAEGRRYVINGREYQRAANFDYDIRLLMEGIFFLDIEGKIAAVDTSVVARENYAYLVNMGEVGTFEMRAQFLVFTREGETRTLTGAPRIRVNDEYTMTYNEILTSTLFMSGGNTIRQLITFNVNARGEITAIRTAYDNTASRTPIRDRFTLNIRDTLTFTSANNRLGPVRIDANTIVFDVPAHAGNDTSLFSVRTASMFSNQTSYDVLVYDMTEDFVARAIVVTSTTGVTAADAPIAVVDRVTSTHNPDLIVTDRLHAVQNGQRIEILAADTTVLRKSGNRAIQQGDIIQFRTNARGEIDRITVLFDVGSQDPDALHRDTEAIKNIGELTIAFGRVTRRFAGSVNVTIDDAVHNFSTNNVHVYEFDSRRHTNQVRVVTAGDIQIYEAPVYNDDGVLLSPGNQWYLFVKQYRGVVEEMVIIR